ncbi:amidohydrolase family protein [Geodermatophilus sabuli]|uniref:Predicted metal-dependent hydrolase, TIM-barrel fold n=1 Tax=Geodermatophilus sabuli TaxID=1564158 RepID=A0A285EC66_9ACTN|nr:amidohydrolase family protein [Geodermatophilus sabuli]MBB3083561.1 putative TIM-barrel fold metal-dependent hydrolase [Geodermatophilus sabuli]SNX96718.1 Predicted metal-dependent hydrolase, TIM-barrel fold [Geodermatophilus sabuli]
MDGHAHVFRSAAASPRGVDELAPADREATAEDLLVHMDAAGVTSAVLVPLDGADDDVAEALDRHPSRFAAVAVATPAELGTGGVDPVTALRARRDRWPFGALRTMWLGEPGRPVADSPALPVLRALAAEQLPLWSYLPPEQLPLLEELVRLLPELPVVLNHLGFCPHDMWVDEHRRPRFADPFPEPLVERLLRLGDAPLVHVLVSGQYALSTEEPPYADLFPVTRRLAAVYGAERLLWGSDHPWPSDVPGYPVLTGLVDAALPDLDQRGRARVLGGTARALFPRLAAPAG